MPTKQPSLNGGNAWSRVEDALTRLSNEDSKLARCSLDAAVAGAIVARRPWDTALRLEASEAWNSIKPVITEHIASEEEVILPKAKMREDFPPALVMHAHEQHGRLRYLAETIDQVSFVTGTDKEVVEAGTALTAFAILLDDLIHFEERDLLPRIRQILWSERQGS